MKKYYLTEEERNYILKEEEEFNKTVNGKRAMTIWKVMIMMGIAIPIIFLIGSIILDFVFRNEEVNGLSEMFSTIGISSFIINMLIILAARLVYESMLFNYMNSKK